ncbi:hypothetical protein LTR38_018378, partial [Friedmanniomyces endolithicus]
MLTAIHAQKDRQHMKTVEIWPKDIELGDAVSDDLTVTYLRMTDPESGLEVIAFIRPEAMKTLIA